MLCAACRCGVLCPYRQDTSSVRGGASDSVSNISIVSNLTVLEWGSPMKVGFSSLLQRGCSSGHAVLP